MRASRATYGAVGIGSAAGAVLRHLVAIATVGPGAASLPWATLGVNVAGSFVIGWFATLTRPDGGRAISPAVRHFVMAGFCGGLTTFSIFSLETVLLFQDEARVAAALNIILSLLLWIPSAWAGQALARRLPKLERNGLVK